MNIAELLLHACTHLERLGVPYMVTGSVSSAAYGEPRSTNDVDIVIDLTEEMIPDFCSGFADEAFYYSEDAIRDAVRQRFQFNVLHTTGGYKIDFILLGNSEYDLIRMGRARDFEYFPNRRLKFASPEDVILKKLYFYKEGGSEKHLRDIAGMIDVIGNELDYQYIRNWSKEENVAEIWDKMLESTKRKTKQ
jgi:hypothetical protein